MVITSFLFIYKTCHGSNIQLCPASITQTPFWQIHKYSVCFEWFDLSSKFSNYTDSFLWTYGYRSKDLHPFQYFSLLIFYSDVISKKKTLRSIFRFNRQLLAFSLTHNWIWSFMWPCANSIIFFVIIKFTHGQIVTTEILPNKNEIFNSNFLNEILLAFNINII